VPKRLLVIICLLLVGAAGGSRVRLDLSSEASYRESLQRMKAQMADEEQARLDLALARVLVSVLEEIDRRMLATVLRGESGRVPTIVFEALKSRLHGKTARQVFDLAGPALTEFDQQTLIEMLASKTANLDDELIDCMIAEKRASIDSTDDQARRETKLKELQLLLRLRYGPAPSRARSSGGRYRSGIYGPPPGTWSSSCPMMINIGNSGYRIPTNFVSHFVWDGSQDNHQHVIMLALWPGMEPRTEENNRQWQYHDDAGVRVAEWNAERQIRITLAGPGYLASDGYERFQRAFRFGNVVPGGEERYGLIPYVERTGTFPTTFYIAKPTEYRTPQNTPVVLRCQDAAEGIMETFPVKIRCEIQYALEENVGLQYVFYATSLEDWQERDIAVRQLVTSFGSLQ
jgi:hypothetical protein